MATGAGAAHLARIGAQPRPAGGAATAEARAYCADTLRELGFATSERSFEYSKFPGGWAAPAAGLLVPAAATALLYARPLLPVAGLAIALLLLGAGGRAVLDLPFLRARGVNLSAVRGAAEPRVWLVAHLDSKWQPVSMLARVAGVVGLSIGVAGVLLSLAGASLAPLARPALALAWIGGLPLILSVVGARNHGTLDNASGVAAVLAAVEELGRGVPLGVVITDAEEYALAGARAWARSLTPGVALNCDSVDDDGPLVVMYTRGRPARLVALAARAAQDLGTPLRVLRLIPGILTDSVALADAGWETLTLSRGTIRTLQRIHTRRDTLAAMSGSGIAAAAALLARIATELAKGEPT